MLGGAATAFVLASTLAACGGGGEDSATPVLNWYINPDSGGQATIAERCSEESDGAYRIAVSILPRESSAQREQLVRRLAANDASIDIVSLDPPYIPEFAQAGFLAPVPADLADRVTEGVVQSSIEGSTWNEELVTVPFWANTQLLWYRKSVAEAAGLDMTQPVTWEQIVQAAQDTGTIVSAQGRRAESLTVWFNALIESAGGSVIEENSTDPDQIQLGLTSPAGERAAEVMALVADSGVVGAAFSTSSEDTSATQFESEDGGFMVNWPFVWSRALSAVEAGTLDASVPDDYGWTIYPRVDAETPSAPPYGGINLGVGAFSDNVDLAYQATECITTDENQAEYMITNGNPASSVAVYDDPEVQEAFPMAATIRDSLELAAPRPQTPYYSEVSGGLQREYHPPSSASPETAQRAAELISAVLSGEQLL
ncbi:multiple sugar transport system substrate-binding protein [Geodermatophilus bullaregiensis]|uniref:extracellular solute-binding protein n=1 Tax=Geodermatophilus bullaregiensis TaxID=1564160 RepID=UPI0027DC458C|nr:extracellular solute-binding protein [Geodermatophilus bullaregiensis]MBM7805410.1 multiple sugar transport system substrate-binding protein [Geodermatophilus bullaregiensis]